MGLEVVPRMASPRKYSMVTLDVFSARPLEGNPLAVFTDGRGLSDGEMQAIAKETNLSETTFILPRDAATEAERGVRVRIFTVQEELPFAGHPTLGTAFVLRGASGAQQVKLDLNVGPLPVTFEDRDGNAAFGEMTQVEPKFGVTHEIAAVAQIAGLATGDFDSSLPIETVSTGVPFTIVPLKGLEAMRRLNVNHATATEYMVGKDAKFFYFVCRETVQKEARLHARMLFYNGEDPATGSAGGCATAWMVAHRVAQPEERVLIEQGLEMNRPSKIWGRAGKNDNRVVNVRIGGHAVEVMHAEVSL
jgi:trans-2,3-dihydro-3-hydroxyanthranilate isomerase